MFTCEQCGLNIKNEFNYLRHLQAKVSCKFKKKVNGKYQCNFCMTKFTRMDNYTRHMREMHKNEEMNHIGSILFSCGISECKQSFQDVESLYQHRKTHEAHQDFRLVTSAHGKSCQLLRAFFPKSIKGLTGALFYAYQIIIQLLCNLLIPIKFFKVNLTIFLEMIQLDAYGHPINVKTFPFTGKGFQVSRGVDFKRELQLTLGDIERNVEEFLHQGSGWIAGPPVMIQAEVTKCKPLYGKGCGLHTSKYIRNEGITNVVQDSMPDDGLCFYYAIASGILGKDCTKEDMLHFMEKKFGLNNETKSKFPPMDIKKIKKIEEKHTLSRSINVIYQDEEGDCLPVYASRKLHLDPIVLMLFQTTENDSNHQPIYHYSIVHDPNMLFAKRHVEEEGAIATSRTTKRYICYNCFNTLDTSAAYKNHVRFCHENKEQVIIMPDPGDKLSFKASDKSCDKSFKSAFMLFFDFESLNIPADTPCSCSHEVLENTEKYLEEVKWFEGLSLEEQDEHLAQMLMIDGEEAKEQNDLDLEAALNGTKPKKAKVTNSPKLCHHKTKMLKEQPPFSYSLVLCDRNRNVLETKSYIGEDCGDNFIDTVLHLSEKYLPTLSPGKPMEKMTPYQLEALYQISHCYLCGYYMHREERVLDHDHLTGSFLGTAHNICNLKRKESATLCCFAHNFSNYDSHFLIRSLNRFPKKIHDLFSIPLNGQKFKSFTINKKISFLDSISFIPDSLAKCVEMLKKIKMLIFNGKKSFQNNEERI